MTTIAKRNVVCAMAGLALWWLAATALAVDSPPPGAAVNAAREQVAAEKGICVVLGLADPQRPGVVADLAAGNEWLVYFQSPTAGRGGGGAQGGRRRPDCWARASSSTAARGSRSTWPTTWPATIWVSAGRRRPSRRDEELLRVLHPEGKAIVGGQEIVKPFPAGIDAWSHPYHGPDNNPQSSDQLARMPYLTQFLAEPLFCPMPEVTVAAGGRVFKAFGHIAHKANQNAMLNTLLGINGYNGTILWKRPLREGFMIHRNTMIATPEMLYLADDESCKLLDAAHGRGPAARSSCPTAWPTARSGSGWPWSRDADGRDVLYALVGGEEIQPKTVPSQTPGLGHWPWGMWEGHDYKDPKTNFGFGRTLGGHRSASKKVLWQHDEHDYIDGRGVCMNAGRIYFYSPEKFLGCLDAETGKVLWKNSDADLLEAIGPTGRAQNATRGLRHHDLHQVRRQVRVLRRPAAARTWWSPRPRTASCSGRSRAATCSWSCATTPSTRVGPGGGQAGLRHLADAGPAAQPARLHPGHRQRRQHLLPRARRGRCGSARPTTTRSTSRRCARPARTA